MKAKFLSFLLVVTMLFSVSANCFAADSQNVDDFVTRLYKICLGREAEEDGLKYWTDVLKNGEQTGTSVAAGFIFSPELQNKSYSNGAYVDIMYDAFFGRKADSDGKAYWVDQMNAGMTREEIFTGFANSPEFFDLCDSYDIVAGTFLPGRDYLQVARTNLFVERLYNVVLGRKCDKEGMMYWTCALTDGTITGTLAAYGFFFSPEYENSRKLYSEYINDLYAAIMGREPDADGHKYWMDLMMLEGATKEQIFNGFAMAPEFTTICSSYGILQGGIIPTDNDTTATLVRDVRNDYPTAAPTKKPSGDPTGTPSSNATPTPTLDPSGNPFSTPPVEPGTAPQVDAKEYTYEIIPMLAPFNSFFYIKTENPNPFSFRFADNDTKYNEKGGSIEICETRYYDVTYTDADLYRVSGGYIASGSYTDGGDVTLVIRTLTGSTPVYNLTTGETTYRHNYAETETNVTVSVPKVMDNADYLLETYGGKSTALFDRLSDIQSGFSSVCLYSGASVKGRLVKSETYPYYGLSNSPHVDQTFYIQSPYSRKDSKPLLVSSLYPFRYDSLGFPGMIATIAKRIDPSVTSKQNSNNHAYVDITCNGETKTYGGAGFGGGQQILENQINLFFKFDGSKSDAYPYASLKNLSDQLRYYGSLEVPDDIPQDDRLTWADVRKTIGDGTYVSLIGLYSVFGSSGTAYTYLYDNGSTSTTNGFVSLGCFSNAWFDGRYYSRYEIMVPGVKFGDTVYDIDTGKSPIVVKDAVLNFDPNGTTYYYGGKKIDESMYDSKTGVWKGYTYFVYDEESGNWLARQLTGITTMSYQSSLAKTCTDPDFIDACTLTPDEVKAMNVDRNTDVEPTEYYIYDKSDAPGTYHKK